MTINIYLIHEVREIFYSVLRLAVFQVQKANFKIYQSIGQLKYLRMLKYLI